MDKPAASMFRQLPYLSYIEADDLKRHDWRLNFAYLHGGVACYSTKSVAFNATDWFVTSEVRIWQYKIQGTTVRFGGISPFENCLNLYQPWALLDDAYNAQEFGRVFVFTPIGLFNRIVRLEDFVSIEEAKEGVIANHLINHIGPNPYLTESYWWEN